MGRQNADANKKREETHFVSRLLSLVDFRRTGETMHRNREASTWEEFSKGAIPVREIVLGSSNPPDTHSHAKQKQNLVAILDTTNHPMINMTDLARLLLLEGESDTEIAWDYWIGPPGYHVRLLAAYTVPVALAIHSSANSTSLQCKIYRGTEIHLRSQALDNPSAHAFYATGNSPHRDPARWHPAPPRRSSGHLQCSSTHVESVAQSRSFSPPRRHS